MRNIALLPYLLSLALLAACVETDISVPGFPEMVRYFSTTEAQVQMTMGINFLAFCIAGLFHGPLSDSYGRRRVMLIGNVVFLIGAIGSATASSIEILIAWRFFQGLGASAGFTVGFAMVADAYKGEKASTIMNRLNGVLTAAMAGAPVLGGFLVQAYGWRSTYSSIAVLCIFATLALFVFLPETNTNLQPFKPRQILRNFSRLLTSIEFLGLTLVPTLQCTGYMAFVAGAVFFYVETMGTSLLQFTAHQACVIGCFSIVSLLAGQITAKLGTRNTLKWGLASNVFGSITLLLLALFSVRIPVAYTFAMSLYSIGIAFCYGPSFTASMELFPDIKGSAASLNMAIRLFVMAMAINAIGILANHTFIPETSLIFASGILGAACLIFVATKPNVLSLLLQEREPSQSHAPI